MEKKRKKMKQGEGRTEKTGVKEGKGEKEKSQV